MPRLVLSHGSLASKSAHRARYGCNIRRDNNAANAAPQCTDGPVYVPFTIARLVGAVRSDPGRCEPSKATSGPSHGGDAPPAVVYMRNMRVGGRVTRIFAS